MRYSKQKISIKNLFILILFIVGIALSVFFLNNKESVFTLLSRASNPHVTISDLGLEARVTSTTPSTVTIDATWNPITASNFAFFTLAVRKKDDNIRQNDDEGRNLGTDTQKTLNLPLCPGEHSAKLRAYYKDGSIQYQEQNLSYEGPITAEGKILVGNPGFETMITDKNKPEDGDPDCWTTAEGLMIPGTGTEKQEKPSMVHVVSAKNGVTPRSGSYMLENVSELDLKSHVRSFYIPSVKEGKFIQKASVYIPNQSPYLNQLEIRQAAGGENLHIRWTEDKTSYCWRLTFEEKGNGKEFCKELPPLTPNTWHDYTLTIQQLKSAPQYWRININLDGTNILTSNGQSIPHIHPLNNKFGFIFLGDECQGNAKSCDGIGTFYYDNIETYWQNN